MRKIERDMIAAIRAGKNRTLGNTYVNPVIGGIEVHLFGNHIATLTDDGMRFTLAGWPTPTTRSRINALLSEFRDVRDLGAYFRVYQIRGRQFYGSHGPGVVGFEFRQEISPTEWVQA